MDPELEGLWDGRVEARRIAVMWRAMTGGDGSCLPPDGVNEALSCRQIALSAARGDTYAGAFVDAYRGCLTDMGVVDVTEAMEWHKKVRRNVN